MTQGAFRHADGLASQTQVIEYQDGDDIILRKRPGRTEYSTIVLKKGYVNSPELYQWRRAILAGDVAKKTVTVTLVDDAGNELARYVLREAWPTKWKGFYFYGKGNDVAVEEIELAIEKIERTP